jgi:hypothetical protein
VNSPIDYRIELAMRQLQVLLPIFVSIIFVFTQTRRFMLLRGQTLKDMSNFLGISQCESQFVIGIGIAGGIILRSSAIYTRESIWSQGNWYFPESILFTTFLINFLLMKTIERKRIRVHNTAKFFTLFLISLVFLSFFPLKIFSTYNQNYVNLYDLRNEVCKEIEVKLGYSCLGLHMAEFDDGWINYFLQIDTVNAFGLSSDISLVKGIKRGELNKILDRRCYRYYISSNYPIVGVNGMLDKKIPEGAKQIDISGLNTSILDMGLRKDCLNIKSP